MPETVDLTNYTELSQSEEAEESEVQPGEEVEEQPPKRQRTGSRPKTRSTIRPVPVKLEDRKNGNIHCPDCGNTIFTSEKGCKLVTCTNHQPQFLYFCVHCGTRQEPFATSLKCKCPGRNTPEDRMRAQEMRNKRARENPVVLE